MNEIIARLITRGGTAAQWTAANPLLALNEKGRETDTGKIKWGNGTDSWNDLPYETVNSVPNGGTTGQVLAKASNADNDTEWVDQSGGGGVTGRKIYSYNNIAQSVTGTTTETILSPNTFFIAANDLTANGVADIVSYMGKVGNNGSAEFNVYLNTSYSLSGAQLLHTSGSAWGASTRSGGFSGVRVVNRNSQSSQIGSDISSPFFDFFSSSSARNLTVDFTQKVYVIITGKLTDVNDVLYLYNCQLYVNNP